MIELAIKIGGGLSAGLAIAHCVFYRGFGWQEDFEKTRVLTAKVLYTIHIFLIPFFFFFAFLSFTFTKELAGATNLGISISIFYSLFWLLREVWQIFYFMPSKLKISGSLRLLHYFLVTYFFLLFIVYALPVVIFIAK